MHTPTNFNPQLERQARRAAGVKRGWYIHALVYVCVNLILALLSSMTGKHWAVFPALGWGLGLAIHGLVVFFVTGGAGFHEKLIQRERDRLGARQENANRN
ncbi:MAG: 2TM domain-containing protein [Polaromonas sp.]